MDEGRDEWLIEWGGEAVEVEDDGFEVEWGIEAEGNLWRITLRRPSAEALHAGMLLSSAMYTRIARLGSEGAREAEAGRRTCDHGGFTWGLSDSASTSSG